MGEPLWNVKTKLPARGDPPEYPGVENEEIRAFMSWVAVEISKMWEILDSMLGRGGNTTDQVVTARDLAVGAETGADNSVFALLADGVRQIIDLGNVRR